MRSFILLLLSLSLLSACSRIQRARECQNLAREINAVIAELEPLNKVKDPAKLEQAASKYEALSKSLEQRSFETKGLGEAVKSYSKLLSQIAETLRTLGKTAKKDEATAFALGATQMKALASQQKRMTARVDRICQAP